MSRMMTAKAEALVARIYRAKREALAREFAACRMAHDLSGAEPEPCPEDYLRADAAYRLLIDTESHIRAQHQKEQS